MDIIENILSRNFNQDITNIIIMSIWKEKFNLTIKQVKEIEHNKYNNKYNRNRPYHAHTITFNNRRFKYYAWDNDCGLSELTRYYTQYPICQISTQTKLIWRSPIKMYNDT